MYVYVSCTVITYDSFIAIFTVESVVKGRFRFSCTHFDCHSKDQSFKTAKSGCVCTECRAILKLSQSLNPKEPCIKKIWYPDCRGDFVYFVSMFGLCPLINKYSSLYLDCFIHVYISARKNIALILRQPMLLFDSNV